MTRMTRMNKEEANAWMEANKHRIGIPAEISTVKVKGKLFHDTKGDGHTTEWWKTDSRVKWSEKEGRWKTKAERTKRSTEEPMTRERGRLKFRDAGLLPTDGERYEETRPMVQRGKIHMRAAFDFGQPEELTRDEKFLKSAAHRQAVSEMATHGELQKTTVVMGERVPREMWYDKQRGSHARRSVGVIVHMADAFPVSGMTADEMVPDTRWLELVALSDLRQLLRSYITEKEMEALEESAFGNAVKDRHCLARARRKAQPVMAGKIVIRGRFKDTGKACWSPLY